MKKALQWSLRNVPQGSWQNRAVTCGRNPPSPRNKSASVSLPLSVTGWEQSKGNVSHGQGWDGFSSIAPGLTSSYTPCSRGPQRHILMATAFSKEKESPIVGTDQ